jgi:hypothetical protein
MWHMEQARINIDISIIDMSIIVNINNIHPLGVFHVEILPFSIGKPSN